MSKAEKTKAKPKKNDRETREKILWASEQLFAEHGYNATSISKIAKKAGVLSGSIYWLFESKNDIFSTLMIDRSEEWKQMLEESGEFKTAPPQNLEEFEKRAAEGLYLMRKTPIFIKLVHVAVVEGKTEDPEVRSAIQALRARWIKDLAQPMIDMYPDLPEKQVREICKRYGNLLIVIGDGMYMRSAIEGPRSGIRDLCETSAKLVVASMKQDLLALQG